MKEVGIQRLVVRDQRAEDAKGEKVRRAEKQKIRRTDGWMIRMNRMLGSMMAHPEKFCGQY